MKIGGVNAAMIQKIEVQKLDQQALIHQQQLKIIKERQKELAKNKPTDLDKGSNVDKLA